MATVDLTSARLRDLLYYDPFSGALLWRKHRKRCPRGTEATKQHASLVYPYLFIGRVMLKAHRVIWALVTGKWPQNFQVWTK